MRLYCAVFLLIVGLTAYVEASTRANPYQVMFFWNTYQIEIAAHGLENTKTARDCNRQRACTFDEFIKHIEGKRKGFQGSTGLDADARAELPTVQTAEHLRGIEYSSMISQTKLYPEAGFDPAHPASMGEVLDQSLAAIEQARRVNPNPGSLDKFLTLAGEALDYSIEMRRADYADTFINWLTSEKAVPAKLPAGITLKYLEKTLPNKATYKVVDYHATLTDPANRAQGAAIMAQLEDKLDYYMNGGYEQEEMGENPKGNNTKRHLEAIRSLQQASAAIRNPADICG